MSVLYTEETEANLEREEERRLMKVNEGKELASEPTENLAAAETADGVTGHTPTPWRLVAKTLIFADDERGAVATVDPNWARPSRGYLTQRIGMTDEQWRDSERDEWRDERQREVEANARLIVKAVNSHNALIATLKRCLQQMREASDLLEMFPDDYGEAINEADALLLKVDARYAELDAKLKAIRAAANEPERDAEITTVD